MDCPTEQTLIQNKLGKLAGVQQLEFNLAAMKIGELAKLTDCPVETIRYYEKEGLLPPPARTDANYREPLQNPALLPAATALAQVQQLFLQRQQPIDPRFDMVDMLVDQRIHALALVLGTGVDGIAHSVASVKVPVAK
jgi:hypothetical protein